MQINIKTLIQELEKENYSIVLMRREGIEILQDSTSSKLAIISQSHLDTQYLSRIFTQYAEIRIFSYK
jgi:hypothetical protein